MANSNEIQKIVESLSPHERKVLIHAKENKVSEIAKKTELDQVSVMRALEYLQNKNIVKLSTHKKKIIEVGVNGVRYKKSGLPERKLLHLLGEKRILSLSDAEKLSGLSEDEFKAAIGALKKKAMIEIKNQKIHLEANAEEISKKMLEEIFIESLPLEFEKLSPEKQHALKILEKRKEIIHIIEKKTTKIQITEIGKEVLKSKIVEKDDKLIEQLTPEIIKSGSWKGKKFRRYDIVSGVPEITGGKIHFVNQAIDYARKVWTEMGFKEMAGNLIQSSFWNFDALFTAQDHPVREMQDTFFLSNNIKNLNFPDKKIIAQVKQSHEQGLGGSRGWNYEWSEEESKKVVLRTHTTCLSALTLSTLKSKDTPAKFFAIGKCFRNETVDWSHGFEFNQTEGIVVDENANFRHLLGYLKQFFNKMGFEKIRFTPAYFPYTEPSVEINWWHPEKKIWLELGGAGIFRPELTIPLLGKHIPVLAWGPGFDRIIMDYYKIKDLREMYKNDLNKLRKIKFWVK